MLDRVGPPRPPALGVGRQVVGASGEPEALSGVANPEVGGQEAIWIAEGPEPDVRSGPGPDPGQLEEPALDVAAVGAASMAMLSLARAAHRPCSARRRATGMGNVAGSASASALAVGNEWVSPPSDPASGRPWASARRPATVRAPATDTCWPITARTASSSPSTAPGARRPGHDATIGASAGSASRTSATATGSASRSSRRRQRCTAVARSATASRRSEQETWSAAGRNVTTPVPRGSVNVRRYAPSTTSSTPGTARAPRKAKRPLLSKGGRKGRRSTTSPADRGAVAPAERRSSEGVTAKTARTVSLNWRTLENPAAKATSVSARSVVSTSTRAVWLRCARARAWGPAPTSARRSRWRWRSLTARRRASPCTPSRSTTPSAMKRMARPTRSARLSHSGEPGLASGRQRLQARNPALWAAAVVGKKRTFTRLGRMGVGQLGRQ